MLPVISPVVREGSNIRPVIIITEITALSARNPIASNGALVCISIKHNRGRKKTRNV